MSLIADRANRIKPSPTLAVTAKAAELKAAGHSIISLGAGEPDFDTPDHIKQAAIEAIQAGHTKYTAVDGIPALKSAVINKLTHDNQLNYSNNQILVSSGAKQSIYNLLAAVLNPGDEVLIPTPYWVSYPDMVQLCDGTPITLPTTAEQTFKLSASQLEDAITPKTKLLILNSPSNPTGVAYSREELVALGQVLAKYPNLLIASDDIYEHVMWSSEPFCNIAMACPDLYDRTIVINGISKAYSMTGWRIGYAAGPEPIIKTMKKIQSQSTSNPCSISQYAGIAALAGPQDCIKPMLEAFKSRHDYLVEALNQIPGVRCLTSDGAFYAFADVTGLIHKTATKNDVAFAEALLTEAGVAVVPGSAFGLAGFVRLSFATSMENLQEAITRFTAFAEKFVTV